MTQLPRRRTLCALTLAAVAAACGLLPESAAPDANDPTDPLVAVRGRTVDLGRLLTGVPWSSLRPDLEHGQLLYLETGPDGRRLRRVPLPRQGPVDLTRGEAVGAHDFATRSFGRTDWDPHRGRLLLQSDEANDEHFNVYALDCQTGALERLTDNDYTYAWELSPDGTQLAHLDRRGDAAPYSTCLTLLDLASGTERVVLCDTGLADRFTWTRLRWTADAKGMVVEVQHDGNRATKSLAYVDLTAAQPRFEWLIEPRVERFSLWQVEGWVGDGRFVYVSGEGGQRNLWAYDLAAREARRLSDLSDELGGVKLLDTDPPTVLAVLTRPHESELLLLDPADGRELARQVVPASVALLDAHTNRAVLSLGAVDEPFRLERLDVSRAAGGWALQRKHLAGLEDDVRAELVHVKARRVSYPTFDTLPDGSPRELHAFYLQPREAPADPADRRVVITAFYGGSNSYSTTANVLGAAGIATFSPAVRGSRGFGPTFAALNDGDLGGDEIVDLFEAARWLVEREGYAPWQIGVHGGSHGGYATMRALTFPPGTNGHEDVFPFGYGWSHAGFSDIASFHATCNIPDWVLLEAGDPVAEADKLADRSPLTHVDKLVAPLLLTHGANDWRVPVEESRRFAEAAAILGRPVEYVEFEGQGHGIRGLDNRVRYYRAVLEFLEDAARDPDVE